MSMVKNTGAIWRTMGQVYSRCEERWRVTRDWCKSRAMWGRSSGLADGAEAAQAGEEFVGARDIAGDLRAQLFGAAEFFLFAKTVAKPHFDAFRCRRQFSIEQMRFDAERRAVNGGAHADIRDRAVTARLSFKARARDVNAASREQFLFRCQIQGREGEAATCPGAADHFTRESEGPAQKTRGVGHVALGDFAANDGAGDDFSAIDHRGNDHDIESMFCAKLGQQLHVTRLPMSKAKIFADQNGLYTQIAEQNLLDEFVGREPREIEREREDHNRFEAERVEPLHTLRVGREPRGRSLRAKHFPRRGIKRESR